MTDLSSSDAAQFLAEEVACARQLISLLARTLDRIEAAAAAATPTAPAGQRATHPSAKTVRFGDFDVPRLPATFGNPGPVDEDLRAQVLTFAGPVDVDAAPTGPATPAEDTAG
jgi:hypothetical protein